MAIAGRRPRLRELFDDAPTPHIAHRTRSHRRDYYVAADGSFSSGGGGLGAIIETGDGNRVARLALPDDAPDNNVAEYRALHLGLDVLAARSPSGARVGVLVDHDNLAENVNEAVLAGRHPDNEPLRPLAVPPGVANHWRGIRARVAGFDGVRAARIDSSHNPAHPLANDPGGYEHLADRPARCPLPDREAPDAEAQIPPPSRADRASD
jgi:ribonuclease HI